MPNLTNFGVEIVGGSFYERLKEDETYKKVLQQLDKEFINEIEKYMAHEFRDYQKQALAAFDFFQKAQRDQYAFKDELYEREFADGTIPFYGFEMATGSGKTLLIGALILYLYKEYGYKNFLIITPGTTIYDKTISNFDMMSTKRVFSSVMDLKYNVVTGDNFTDKSSNYEDDANFTVFIFNIQKFFDRETGTLRVDKEWEESYWKDELGNTISFREYLKNERLVIITDEAHHYQKFRVGRGRKSSGDIILALEPELISEFTATAVTEEEIESRRAQKIIYNYPINDFITDGYGKKVRAYGYSGSPYKAETIDVTEDDKKKFLVAFMIHLLKKKALDKVNFKPILLIRARDISHADNLLDWIQDELPNENDLIENTYTEFVRAEKFEITELISKYVPLDEFRSEIAQLPNKSFVFHSNNEKEEQIKEKVATIETNDQEVLIQIKKLEEGWDIKNPYTILILSVSTGSIKTYVKQLIGRGVRLFREKRKYDDLTGFLDKQQEILHVVCEKGSNFEEFIEAIRKELGLSQTSLETEKIEKQQINKTIAKFERYNELELPVLKLSSDFPLTTEQLVENISYDNLKLDGFIDRNTLSLGGDIFWRWDEREIGVERVVAGREIDLSRGEADYEKEELFLESVEIRRIITQIISSQTIWPSHPSVKVKLTEAIKNINEKEILFKNRGSGSREFYVNNFNRSIVKFIQDVIDNYFETPQKLEKTTLKMLFQDVPITIKKEPETDVVVNVKRKRDVDVEREKKNFKSILITGFDKSFYEYNSFDSSHEFMLAYQLDNLEDVDFWIRNKRSYYYEYGVGNRYHPDFIVKYGSDMYIIEVKGEYLLETYRTKREIEILKRLSQEGYKILFLLDKTVEEKLYQRARSFTDVVNNNDLERSVEVETEDIAQSTITNGNVGL